jgi:hypothetical protein
MATRTASAAQSTAIAKSIRVGLVAVNSTFSMGAGQSISPGDVIQMIRVPANGRAVFVGLTSTYADAAVEIGDGLSTNRYLKAMTTSAAHAVNTFSPGNSNVPYTYSVEDTIDLYVTLASITTIAGAFYLTAIVTMDPVQG